jgi:antitoxin VapB
VSSTAKLFMHGRSQAVRLPKEFRLPGKEVRVTRDGRKVVLEPIGRTRDEVEAIWAEIDALRGRDGLFPDGGFEDPVTQPDRRDLLGE